MGTVGLFAVGLLAVALIVVIPLWWLAGKCSTPPPAVANVGIAGPRDAWRYSTWYLRAIAHRACVASILGRCLASVLLCAGVVLLVPVLWPVQALLMVRPWCRYYDSGNAFLGVAARRDGWHIADHVARTVGDGHGKSLRDDVIPQLRYQVQTDNIRIHAIAANKALADCYCQEVPEFTSRSSTWFGRQRLSSK